MKNHPFADSNKRSSAF
ncbi:hypothetical protein [Neisseria musculi]